MFEFNATLLVAMVSFVVFMFIMNAIFYRPILNIIRKRQDYIESNYLESKDFEDKANKYLDTHSKKIAQTQDLLRGELKKEIDEYNKESNSKIEEAKIRTKQIIQEKKADLLRQEQEIKSKIEGSILDTLTQNVVSKITK